MVNSLGVLKEKSCIICFTGERISKPIQEVGSPTQVPMIYNQNTRVL